MTCNPKNILLINPWIHDFAAFDFWAKPLGFLYLASLLRKSGFTVSFIDCLNGEHSWVQAQPRVTIPERKAEGPSKFLKQRIDKPGALQSIPRHYSRYGIPRSAFSEQLRTLPTPEAILVTSAMTYWYEGVRETIAMAKKIFPQVPIILGGIYATLCPDHARQCSGADAVVSGPGEQRLLEVISALTGRPMTPRLKTADFSSFPYPAFDLIDPLPYVCIATSRGCPYRCRYCASKILSPTYTVRDPMAVVDEIQYWVERSTVNNVAFYDDALFF